jgi:hypothetical protein
MLQKEKCSEKVPKTKSEKARHLHIDSTLTYIMGVTSHTNPKVSGIMFDTGRPLGCAVVLATLNRNLGNPDVFRT